MEVNQLNKLPLQLNIYMKDILDREGENSIMAVFFTGIILGYLIGAGLMFLLIMRKVNDDE